MTSEVSYRLKIKALNVSLDIWFGIYRFTSEETLSRLREKINGFYPFVLRSINKLIQNPRDFEKNRKCFAQESINIEID
jgi:hypothetical protein